MSRGGWAALPRGATGCLQFVIAVFPDHTHLLFLAGNVNKKTTLDFILVESSDVIKQDVGKDRKHS